MTDSGTWLWAVQGDPIGRQNVLRNGPNALTMALDGMGHLFITGGYESTGMRIGSTILPNQSIRYPQPNPAPPIPFTNYYHTDLFVARLDLTTHSWDWAIRNGSDYDDYTVSITADTQGRVYVAGNFDNALPSSAYYPKLAQLDGATGTWLTSQSVFPATISSLALDAQSRLYAVGSFYSTAAQLGSFNLVQAGPTMGTGYIARLAAGPLATHVAGSASPALIVWPNPSKTSQVQVQGPPAGQLVQVLDMLGRVVANGHMPTSGPLPLSLPTNLALGIYIVRSGQQARQLVVN